MKRLKGKQYFFWLGQLDDHNERSKDQRDKSSWPRWAHRAYSEGWYSTHANILKG